MIDISHLSQAFTTPDGKTVHAVKDVTLHINKGEIFGIIGRSGAGKSTLVRTINFLNKPTEGTVRVNNQCLNDLNADELRTLRSKIGMIFQHFNLLSSRTVFENIALPLELHNVPKEEIEKKQAKRNKIQAIFDSIIATAVAVTKALPNIPLSVLVGVLGAAQTAMIAAQPLPGAEEGGPIDVVREQDGRTFRADDAPARRGFVGRPTVIQTSGGRRVLVGENGGEYVIPAEGLENPSLRPLINTIEAARVTGRLRRLNLNAVIPGRAAGGYTETYTGSPASAYPWTFDETQTRRNEEIIAANTAVMQQLSDRLKKGINAYSVLTGQEGFEKQQQRLRRIRNNTQI